VVVTPPEDLQVPSVSGATVRLNSASSELVITGSHFGSLSDMSVNFDMGNGAAPVSVTPDAGTATELNVEVPNNVTLGLAQITVTEVIRDIDGNPVSQVESNSFHVQAVPAWVFTAQSAADSVSVVDDNPASATFNQQVASISLNPSGLHPTALAVSRDNTRVYVVGQIPKSGNTPALGYVAVLDAVTLQQIDTGKGLFDSIYLGQAINPFQIAISPNGRYAFISDGLVGSVYVLDIDPGSPTYHSFRTLALAVPEGQRGVIKPRDGLRGLDVTSDGKYLFVAAPNRKSYYADPDSPTGAIWKVTVDPDSPAWADLWATGKPLPQAKIDAGDYPYGVTASPDTNIVAFTDILDNLRGVGFINVASGGPPEYVASVRRKKASLQSGYRSDNR
jgi:DNA-binding beta-propeller fold protein YncE